MPRSTVNADNGKNPADDSQTDMMITEVEGIDVSARGYQTILDLLAQPPEPNAKLRAAATALPGL